VGRRVARRRASRPRAVGDDPSRAIDAAARAPTTSRTRRAERTKKKVPRAFRDSMRYSSCIPSREPRDAAQRVAKEEIPVKKKKAAKKRKTAKRKTKKRK
jgi:hypothetical protein